MSINQDANIEVKIKQTRFFIILGTVVVTLLLVLFAIISMINRADDNGDQLVTEITLCDLDSSELCIVTFGANNLNRMMINFQLPNADYTGFYVKAKNRGTINVYSCETANAIPTSTYCTGIRTPLGESIDIEVYTTDGDMLIARGTFIVSAILLSTPANLPSNPESGTPRPTRTPMATLDPTQTESTPTPDTAYPNP
jgi:hypothetical protein